MNRRLLKTLGVMGIAFTTSVSHAQDTTTMNATASFIEMTAASPQTGAFAEFLTDAAPMVKSTEPGTTLWFALQATDNKLAIFDVFKNENARQRHFAGAVAAALKDQASTLVQGGWDDGVLANVHHSSVLSAKAPTDLYSATTASYIAIKAVPGKGEALAQLLTAAGPIVTDTEPQTLYWVALRLDAENFAIFDIFADTSGRDAHFAGKVASLLKDRSSALVDGGWDSGVVANVSHYAILAIN